MPKMTPRDIEKSSEYRQNASSLWLHRNPLILASSSTIRSKLLTDAGLTHKVVPAHLDERKLEATFRENPDTNAVLSEKLAAEKAIVVSKFNHDHYVIGADQTCIFKNKLLHKSQNIAELKSQLMTLRGKTHSLMSSACITLNGQIIAQCTASAKMQMRTFSEEFLDIYLSHSGDRVLSSVGGYQIESYGINLFSKIDGDRDTIMGLPLLDILKHLRNMGLIMH